MIQNPVLYKEVLMRLRFRQNRTTLIGAGVTILAVLAMIYYFIIRWLLESSNQSGDATGIWYLIAGGQYLLICLHAPSSTANAITQEREQQTWEMLIFTQLKPSEIILGKLLARLMTVLFIMVAFMPLTLIAMLFSWRSGNSTDQITVIQYLLTYLVMGVTGLFYATLGLFFSWLLKRTLSAIIAVYIVVIGGFCIGTTAVSGIISTFTRDYRFMEMSPLMWVNPVYIIGGAFSVSQTNSGGGFFIAMLCGIPIYISLTVLLLWRMVAGFRRFVYD